MEKRKKTGKSIFFGTMILLIVFCGGYAWLSATTPKKLAIWEGDSIRVGNALPLRLTVPADAAELVTIEEEGWESEVLRAGANSSGTVCPAQYRLFGVLPVSNATITILPKVKLAPSGHAVGVRMMTDGIMVVGFSKVETEAGAVSPALESGFALQDVILSVNGNKLHSVEQMTTLVEQAAGQQMIFGIRRGETERELGITPVQSGQDGGWHIGLWVRDSAAGIGTVTFVDTKTGLFGALGHGICDADTGQLMPLEAGVIQAASVVQVAKGTKGCPGELQGEYDGNRAGTLLLNSTSGIFGQLDDVEAMSVGEEREIALQNELHTGPATILCNLHGSEVEEYRVELLKAGGNTEEKSLLLRVTDERLLNEAGGIVQGMSGSPILQDGKLAGAVTHVLVNDPACGYGIMIQTMLEQVQMLGENRAVA